jgi:hypothetical protein
MKKELHGAIAELAKPEGFLSVTSMNQLVHNPKFIVDESHISNLFTNVVPLLPRNKPLIPMLKSDPSSSLSRYSTPYVTRRKQRLAPFILELMETNDLVGGDYAEPYAGGAGVAITLLLSGKVSHIHLNDRCKPVYAFLAFSTEQKRKSSVGACPMLA